MMLTLLVKSTLVLGSAILIARVCRRTRAAVRHLVFAAALGLAALLPAGELVRNSVGVEVPLARGDDGSFAIVQDRPVGDAHATGAAMPPAPIRRQPLSRAWSFSTVLGIVWAAGAAMFLLPVVRGLWQLRRLTRTATPFVRERPYVQSLAAERGISRPVTVLRHDSFASPVTYGLRRPVLLLPNGAERWSEEALTRAVMHELEHVRRGDWAIHGVARLICACYWWHPLAWVALSGLDLEAERACDDAVLAQGDGPAYAEQLVMLAQPQAARAAHAILAMARRGDLSTRVRAVLDGRQPRGRAGRWMVLAAAGTTALIAIALAPVTAFASRQLPMPAPMRPHIPSSAVELVRTSARVEVTARRRTAASPLDATMAAQSATGDAALRAFEAATIRPVAAPRAAGGSRVSPDRFFRSGITLANLINYAYDMRPFRILGGPEWVRTQLWEVSAKAQREPSPDEMRHLVQELLADRFALKVHLETREVPIYDLVLARSGGRLGARMKAAAVDCEPFRSGQRPMAEAPVDEATGISRCAIGFRVSGGVRTSYFNGTPSSRLAELLQVMAGRVIVDKTGLDGSFDVELTHEDETLLLPGATQREGVSLFTALQEQLGLKLESTRGLVDVLVIDHAAPPEPD